MTSQKIITSATIAICLFTFAVTIHGAGQYLKVDYPASTDTNELQTAVTYTLWIPDGIARLRGIIVHQHGAGTAAYDLHWQALATKWDCALLDANHRSCSQTLSSYKYQRINLTHFAVSIANRSPTNAACFSATAFASFVYPSGTGEAFSAPVAPFNSPCKYPFQSPPLSIPGSVKLFL
jgi:hypothetical protein